MPNFARQGVLTACGFDEQLTVIELEVRLARERGASMTVIHTWLSIASSIKLARDHSLNCNRRFTPVPPAHSPRDGGKPK